jgi:hypothetical protein
MTWPARNASGGCCKNGCCTIAGQTRRPKYRTARQHTASSQAVTAGTTQLGQTTLALREATTIHFLKEQQRKIFCLSLFTQEYPPGPLIRPLNIFHFGLYWRDEQFLRFIFVSLPLHSENAKFHSAWVNYST